MSVDYDKPATKGDLIKLELDLRRELLGVKGEVLGIREELAKLRNSIWLNIAVPSLTLIISLVIHYLAGGK